MGISHFYGKPGLSRGSNWIELAFPLESFCRKKGIASEVFLFSPNISASFALIQTLSTLLDETHSCFSRKYSQTYIKWPLSCGNKTNGDLFTGRFSYAVKWYTLIPSCFAFWKLVLLHLVESPQSFFFFTQIQKAPFILLTTPWSTQFTYNWHNKCLTDSFTSKVYIFSLHPDTYYITGWGDFCFGNIRNWKNYFGCTDVCIACRDHKIPRTKFSQ